MEIEIDQLIKRAKNYLDSISPAVDPQITTLVHRYLCILLSSNIDKSIQLILTEFARTHGSEELKRFVAKMYQRGTNYNTEKVIQTLNCFNVDWAQHFKQNVETSDLKEKLDSLYGLRNSISHGELVGVARPTLNGYLEAHQKIIALIKTTVLG
jgi:hypothetical protein